MGRFALTHVAVAALGLASTAAWSLGLGRLTVQSALGETLKAEIDISSITPEEAGTLKVRIAPPDSYRSAGVEYNSVLSGTQVQVARRGDGRQVLRLSSDRSVQEPFVDVILELTWSSGRLVREYTLLFDPPSLARPAAPTDGTSAAMAAAPAEARPVPAPRPPSSSPIPPSAASVAAAPAPAPAPRPAAAVPQRVEAPAAKPAPLASTADSEYKVRPGDTLSRVANRTKPAGISLEQMLVGLYRNNPEAFLGENMNRLKAGVVLQVPGSEKLGSISTDEARQVIQTQSADFSAYRQRLAGAAPEQRLEDNQRQAKGQVQAAVEDRKPAAPVSPDKLTLSKGGKPAEAAPEAKLSKESEKKADAARVAELTRNVEELKKLSSQTKPATPVAAAPAAAASVAIAAPVTMPAAASAPLAASAAPVMAASGPASAPASAPAQAKPAASAPMAPPAPAPVADEPGFFGELLSSPLLLPVGAALLALLGGLGFMRWRGKSLARPKADTGFHESRLQPDSFFGASGGQRVDTRDAGAAASSMSYSLSQLDAIGDVDPVAEADVYLAYGRDLQAEEILKEALRSNPERLAIRLKLLEVYAKRRDIKGFEQLAVQLYAETQGTGEDWAKAQELGRQVDPDNPLYQPGGAPALKEDGRPIHPEPMAASTMPLTAQASTISGAHLMSEPAQAASVPPGLDLDLDLDLARPSPVSPTAMQATQAMPASVEQSPMTMDFDLDSLPVAGAPAAPATEPMPSFDLDALDQLPEVETRADRLRADAFGAPAGSSDANSLDFDLGSLDLDLPGASAQPAEAIPAATATMDEGLNAEFDSLLQEEQAQATDPLAHAFDTLDEGDDPLQRQLELADEFRQIGDTEGARDVLQELLAKASGPLRDKAQAMLNELR
ncbi:MAG: FimV/HubP family polar landmark protein [Roseateles asaccharophilus]|uniref:Pilus assembly protein FimV n=1 Tax=Roseateles asaccharophilus TaxID=582607 RepID=A0A4R6N7N6_9BURK|nr:FimV/HubP family polar landmark protein [Roseateles asaccharophilus]MDN3544762.1 FimV/HubP family polar landmark protein [Roseateles asaccharophilus]TDP09471.1 pilus assembly protein FimV [Roseateles asaccharophilus]